MKKALPLLLAAIISLAVLEGCGYHTGGHSTRLPASMRTIAVPVFVHQT